MSISFSKLLIISSLLLAACNKGKSDNQAKASINVDKSNLSGLPAGQLDSIIVTSTTNWNLVVPPNGSWIAPDRNSGTPGVSKVRLTIAPNTTPLARNAVITINSTSRDVMPATLTVIQTRQ